MEGGAAVGQLGGGDEDDGPPRVGEDGGGGGRVGTESSADAAKRRRDLIESIWEENQGPYEGMEFESREAARVFYNEYARRVGFGTRTGSVRYSQRTNLVIAQRYVCAKQGSLVTRKKKDHPPASYAAAEIKRRSSTRSGCGAMISLKKNDATGKWVVSRVEKRHNHPLVSPENVRYLRSHKHFSISRAARHFFLPESSPPRDGAEEAAAAADDPFPMSREGPSPAATGGDGGGHPNGFVEQEWNYIRIGRQRILGSEAQNVLNYFKRQQAENPAFFYAMQVDEDRCVSNVFWADSKARMAYSYFGDAVVFNTTHKTGHLPFVQFMGTNHHGEPVLFGCALLLDKSESSLVWLFRTWLEAMSRRHPVSMTTDWDETLRSAVSKVFPVTRHRVSKWDVLRECREKLAYIYHVYPTFEEEFHRCVDGAETVSEFELCWRSLIDRYCLGGHEWLQLLYSARQEWVTPYLRDTFFAELLGSDGSEGRSSFFDGYMNEQTTLQDFVRHYERALESRCEEEVKADFDTMHTTPILKTPSPMEKQVAALYTRKLFGKFQEELVETFAYTANKIEEDGPNSKYKVVKFEVQQNGYIVMFNALEKKASCSCQMFEFSGILCRHVLTVFRVVNVLILPSEYVLKRWTRNAKMGDVLDDYSVELRGNSRESLTLRYNNLRHQAIKYVEEGASSVDIYNVAMAALREAAGRVSAAKKNIVKVARVGNLASGSSKKDNNNRGSQVDNMTGRNGLPNSQ